MPGFLAGDTLSETSLFAAVYVLIATLVHAGVVLLAGALQPLLTVPGRRRNMGAIFAILLLGIAVWVAISTAG